MQKLSGFLRFQITKHWLKGGMVGSCEEYIKKVCKAKNIKYVEPKKVEK